MFKGKLDSKLRVPLSWVERKVRKRKRRKEEEEEKKEVDG